MSLKVFPLSPQNAAMRRGKQPRISKTNSKVGDLWLFLAAALANLNTFSRTEFSLTVYEYDLTRYKLRSLGMRIQRHYRAALSSEDFQ